MAEVQFLFDTTLIEGVEKLIRDSKNKLLLISPFIDLDKRVQDALKEKLLKYDFEIRVLFGKNEDNLYRSIKKDSLEFLKQFPNIEIRYEERLHAKFYLNDFDFIMTSLNLYDYSLAKNIEVGITCNYGTKGLLGKVVDGTSTLFTQGVDKVSHDVLGMAKEINPIQKFQTIFENAELKYKTEPTIANASGLKGVIGGKKLDGFMVIVDNLPGSKEGISNKTVQIPTNGFIKSNDENTLKSGKTLSASQISKLLGVSQGEVTKLMQTSGLIEGNKITDFGRERGLVVKNYMGNDYIAFPENLKELNTLKN